jgi:UDP-N-acetylglucosamine 2-epimerase (non-hydrolysing)
MPLVDLIVGARPNFMKIAPLVAAVRERQREGSTLAFRLVHTGQHYDTAMSSTFFEQLSIPHPDVNLEVGSGTQSEQAAAIMVRYEALLLNQRSDLCVVVGDVTSTMACAIAAQKLGVPVAHVEGGIRSGDWAMPEEINRLVTDSITNWFFTTSEVANTHLRRAGVTDDRIYFVGNTMVDTLLANRQRFRQPSIWREAGLQEREYLVVTLHRPSNVDDQGALGALVDAICGARAEMPIIFPVHPRTRRTLASLESLPPNLILLEPQPYLEFNYLVERALAVITDSGGVTEETTVMGVPCMTLRTTTERPETVDLGTNELLGIDPAAIRPAMKRLFAGHWKKGTIPPLWDGKTGERIVTEIERLLDPERQLPKHAASISFRMSAPT